MKSIVKWVGGKKKLSKTILDFFPKEYDDYYEPFAGGLAIFLSLTLHETKKYHLSDINGNLITLYRVASKDNEKLIEELQLPVYVNDKEAYYLNRDTFNGNIENPVEKSALFLYLNKCCFNGLYRENSNGNFNVPFGKMKNPVICDTQTLTQFSKYLDKPNISFTCNDYKKITPKSGDLVYLDPPYHKSYTMYSKNDFSELEHENLKKFIDDLTAINVKIVLSNSATPFILDLYKDYHTHIISTKYSVGGKNADRAQSKDEVIITNFTR